MTNPGAFQRTAFQTDAFQTNQALTASSGLSGAATASFAPKLGDKPSITLAVQAALSSSNKDVMRVAAGSRAAYQAGAFQANVFQQRGDQLSATAALSFVPADLRKASVALAVTVAYASAAAGVLRPTGPITARAGIGLSAHQTIFVPPHTAAYQRDAFQTGAFQVPPAQPREPLFGGQARIDLLPRLVRGGAGKRKPGQTSRWVEPEIAPPTFARFLKRRKPSALSDVIAAERIAPLLKGLPDVGWAKPRSGVPTSVISDQKSVIRTRGPHSDDSSLITDDCAVGTRPPPCAGAGSTAALPTLRLDFLDLDDQFDAMAAIAALPDPAVIEAQRLAAEAQDLHDIAALLHQL